MDTLTDRVREALDDAGVAAGDRVLAAVSGGPDSMALLDLLHRLQIPLAVGHVNYGLRAAAEEETKLVVSWCSDRGIQCLVRRADGTALSQAGDGGLQAAARALRYRFFAQAADKVGARAIATAHHADDNAETLLLNLFRGAGMEGLSAMAAVRPLSERRPDLLLIRPLLAIRRAVVRGYAADRGLPYANDASNEDPRFARARLRATVLPAIEQTFGPDAAGRLARSAGTMRDYLPDWREKRDERFERVANHSTRSLSICHLAEQAPAWRTAIIREAARRWVGGTMISFEAASRVADLVTAQTGRRIELPGGTVCRDRDSLLFRQEVTGLAGERGGIPLPPGGSVVAGGHHIRCSVHARPPDLDSGTPSIVFAATHVLDSQITVRPWHAGDRFRPFGMKGSRLVSDFLTGEKVPTDERFRQLVLVSGDEIVWVVGRRQSESSRVPDGAEAVLRIEARATAADLALPR